MMINPTTIKTWSKLGQSATFFGIAVPEIAVEKDNLRLLTADVSLLSGLERFANKYPSKFLNVGIAEQNMIGIASGLAMEGECVFATTYACFIAVRSLEQIREHLSYLQCNVKIIGTSAGVVASRAGISHWATEDIAFMRALPNLIVMSPADALEAYKMAIEAAKTDKPVYIRLSGNLNCPIVHHEDIDFEIGKAITLMKGTDVAIISTGLMVSESLNAAQQLKEKGVSCSVIDMHTIKPLDLIVLKDAFDNHKLIVTVEEHNIIGGLGSAVAEYKATLANSPRQIFFGIPDSFPASVGSQKYIWNQVGISAECITQRILKEYDK